MAEKNARPETRPTPTVNVGVLADHYQKTFEVAFELWKERNKLFVYLVIVSGLGLILLLRVPTTDDLIVDAIAKFLDITDPVRKMELQNGFPFDILLSTALITMFYLMQRLYSTNLSVMRNYLYLGLLEKELQPNLGLPGGSVSFTREGSFYWTNRRNMQSISKFYYITVLFIVLIPFMAIKLYNDLSPFTWLFFVDAIVSALTISYWWEYARSSFRMDVPKMQKR
ncbi:MAG: hypothetical protein HFACDABA_00514 [Anaerolineales bacterium]|nr:hypothetical protein [Anaerolineales bacterium]